MSVQLHVREYLTFEELEKRWACSTNDLKSLVVHGHLIPSFFINHVAHKVRFSWQADCEPPYWLAVVVETQTDEEWDEPPSHLHDTEGLYYLLHPQVEAALDCRFFYFSTDKDHQEGPGEANVCFMLNSHGKHPLSRGITLEMVLEKGVITMAEIERYESRVRLRHESDVASNEVSASSLEVGKPLHPRVETSYLNIIAGMLELLPTPREGRTSEAAVIAELVENYGDKPGISKSSLEQKFATAKRRIKAI